MCLLVEEGVTGICMIFIYLLEWKGDFPCYADESRQTRDSKGDNDARLWIASQAFPDGQN